VCFLFLILQHYIPVKKCLQDDIHKDENINVTEVLSKAYTNMIAIAT